MNRPRRLPRPWACRLAIAALGWTGSLLYPLSGAQGAGLRDLQDGWLLSPIQTWELFPGTPAEDPPGSRGGAWISAGKTRLFGLPELPVTALSGAWESSGRRCPVRLGLVWERTGEGLFLEDARSAFLGFGSSMWGGLEIGHREILIDRVQEAARFEAALLVERRVAPGRDLELRIRWRCDLLDPPPWFGLHGRRPLADLGLTRPQAGWALGLAVDRRGDGTPGLSLDLTARLGSRIGVGLRADPPTGSLGPTTCWRTGALLVRTSHVVHPALGPTHRVMLTILRGTGGTP